MTPNKPNALPRCYVITRDHLAPADVRRTFGTRHLEGLRDYMKACTAAELARLGGTAFRLYDDDGELYFSGRYFGDPNAQGAFAPLDWAAHDSGCTRIDYRRAGKWETL